MSESDGPTRENSVTSAIMGSASRFNLAQEPQHGVFTSFTQTSLAQRINSALGSFRDRKNKLQDVNTLNGVGGLRAGSKGQLEMDKSIWDVTKGVQVEEERTSAFQRAWEALCQDFKTVVTTVRRDPLVALIPVVLLVLLLGGGLWAVFASADKETRHRREVAQQIVRDKGLYLETELAKAFLPAYVCSVYVRRDPSWPAVNRSFAPLARELIRLSNAGSVLTLSLIPNGIIYTMVPLNGTNPSHDKNWGAIGKDWLQDRKNRDKVFQAISTKNLTIIGPYNLTQGGIGLVAMLTINIEGVAANETFNVPPYVHGELGTWQKPNRTQYGPNLTATPFAPYMYDETTSKKWWGLTTVLISWDILREDVTRLEDLESHGYDYVLARPVLQRELLEARPDLANSSHELAVAWSDAVQRVPLEATNNGAPPRRPGRARPLVYYDLHLRLTEPVRSRILVEGAEMFLYASLVDGWTPSWKVPMVAVTIVLSVLLSAMLFLMLVNRRQHVRLLHAMIPKKVISTLRRGKVFTESFEVVTVLFSDIVSYTTMSAHMRPIEVVQMLDELYQEFDNLAEKHKLYKLDTIGDAFMLVGGAPDVEGAAAAAARVAQMGLDMIRTTSTKVLAGGHVVKIRVGIHSGPAVAAVVGRKAPKYTLFGDTVNTASRMESNGSPMRIHVSAATVELLMQAGGFTIEPRGEIPVKGKGVMTTFWVTGTKVWPEGPCPRREAIDISHLINGLAVAPAKIPENTEGEKAEQQSGPPDGSPQSALQSSPFVSATVLPARQPSIRTRLANVASGLSGSQVVPAFFSPSTGGPSSYNPLASCAETGDWDSSVTAAANASSLRGFKDGPAIASAPVLLAAAPPSKDDQSAAAAAAAPAAPAPAAEASPITVDTASTAAAFPTSTTTAASTRTSTGAGISDGRDSTAFS